MHHKHWWIFLSKLNEAVLMHTSCFLSLWWKYYHMHFNSYVHTSYINSNQVLTRKEQFCASPFVLLYNLTSSHPWSGRLLLFWSNSVHYFNKVNKARVHWELQHPPLIASEATVSIRYFRTSYICQHLTDLSLQIPQLIHEKYLVHPPSFLSTHSTHQNKWSHSTQITSVAFFKNLRGDTLWLLMHHHHLKCKILDGLQLFASWNSIKSVASLYSLLQQLIFIYITPMVQGGNLATHSRTRLEE